MKTVSIEYASRHLDELIDLVETGASVQITQNGQGVARLIPCVGSADETDAPGHEVEEAFHGD